jgi:hypothetical protein
LRPASARWFHRVRPACSTSRRWLRIIWAWPITRSTTLKPSPYPATHLPGAPRRGGLCLARLGGAVGERRGPIRAFGAPGLAAAGAAGGLGQVDGWTISSSRYTPKADLGSRTTPTATSRRATAGLCSIGRGRPYWG